MWSIRISEEVVFFLQGAAGTFQLLQEQVFAHLQTAPTPDLSAECTTALVGLMLAQAQESFCIKAGKGRYCKKIKGPNLLFFGNRSNQRSCDC